MKALVLDFETMVQFIKEPTETGFKKIVDGSPFNPLNRIVSVDYRFVDTETYEIGPNTNLVFYHNDLDASLIDNAQNKATLQEALDEADIVVAHNAKFDITWLLEIGLRVPDEWYCTMIGEYILARGVRMAFGLEATAIRRGLPLKKSELIDDYFKDEIGFEAIPLPIVQEYSEGDVFTTANLYVEQLKEWQLEENLPLNNIVWLMNQMLHFIVEIERNGLTIDRDKLAQVENDYKQELEHINSRMQEIVSEVMGDTPINLNSGDDMSMVVYSRKVIDKKLHKTVFNIGVDAKGKRLRPPRMSPTEFANTIRTTTKIVYRTEALHCDICDGHGFVRKMKMNGEPFKKTNICKVCEGRGFLLNPTDKIAGLKLSPQGPQDTSVHGFGLDKNSLKLLIHQAEAKNNLIAVEFLTLKKRLNEVNTYLNSFVAGIQRWVRDDNVLHAGFNQTITRTGRLSSSFPNFQNQPKSRKFPVRACVVSRFKDGLIMEGDFSGLEFVCAGELSRDPQIIDDIRHGKDIHRQTASIVLQKPKEDVSDDERSGVKPYTFAPLYGGQGAGEPPHIQRYFSEFFVIYKRLGEWQLELMDQVMKVGYIQTPSGRQYRFPGTRRIKGNRTTNSTQIVNYPVQGWATGDIVPLACIRCLKAFRKHNLKSKLVLTVHDSIAADVHPDEVKIAYKLMKEAMEGVVDDIKKLWGHEMALPLKCEIKAGRNWMELEKLDYV